MKASHFAAIASLVFASPALATTLVVPGPAAGNAQGPAPFNYYGSSGSRVQEIYASSFFAGAELINGLSFRAYPGAAPSLFFGDSVDISDVVIRLSTTAAGANESGSLPSATFADNLESDATTVYSGALDLTTAATGTGPQPFDYTVSFSQPFLVQSSRWRFAARRDHTLRRHGERRRLRLSHIRHRQHGRRRRLQRRQPERRGRDERNALDGRRHNRVFGQFGGGSRAQRVAHDGHGLRSSGRRNVEAPVGADRSEADLIGRGPLALSPAKPSFWWGASPYPAAAADFSLSPLRVFG